jgi:ribosomal protein S27AE
MRICSNCGTLMYYDENYGWVCGRCDIDWLLDK